MKHKMYNIIFILLATSIGGIVSLHSQTIAEKKAGIVGGAGELTPEMQKFLLDINKELRERQKKLERLQKKVLKLYYENAEPESYKEVLAEVNDVKENIRILQESWREMATKPGKKDEGYALWHQPETTLEQLVIDYGSSEYVYLIPPEIATIEVSVSSNIPIPQSSWAEMLEQILLQSGVGIKTLNPYLRELYLLHTDLSNPRIITADPNDLDAYPSNARVAFVIAPEPMDVRRVWYFLEKFVNTRTTVLQRIGRVILIVGDVTSVNDLLNIYDFVITNRQELEYKAVPLYRVEAEEMTKVLQAVFEELVEEVDVEGAQVPAGPATATRDKKAAPTAKPKQRRPTTSGGGAQANSLNVIALPKPAQAVFLIGTKGEIDRAESIIREVEAQVGEARNRSIFWYNVKHSDPEEIAQIMQKIYIMMIENRIGYQKTVEEQALDQQQQLQRERDELLQQRIDQLEQTTAVIPEPSFFAPPYYQQGDYVVNPRPIGARPPDQKQVNVGRDNFIVDPKTGSLVMVVETDLIPKLKELIRKLDVPKKMVQIEVMLFERTLRRENSYGLNILKLGDVASNLNQSASAFAGDGVNSGVATCLDPTFVPCVTRGIFEFFYSCRHVPLDFAYKFMMTQDNVHLNASPSVVTMNQTEAIIAIKDERSILVGTVFPDTNTGVAAQNAFTRAQYGIQITVTPTIHMTDEDDPFGDPTNYVSLVSQINFDTFPPGQESSTQPNVNRREIINEVRIPDGQTVIIGGLRRKQTDDSVERIPFLGEIPGIGKLFSHTKMTDEDTELIIFMTPKIISEPADDFARLRAEHLCKRPGDLPAFVCRLNEALDRERDRLFQGYMSILFGRPKPRYICEEVQYNGR